MISSIKKIPTLIGIIILALGTFAGVVLLKNSQVFKIGASAEASPKDVRISNIDNTSFTVSWITDKETLGYVSYGETQSNIDNVSQDTSGDAKTLTHFVTISGLKPASNYYFKINSEGSDFDNSGIPWNAQTSNSNNVSANQFNVSGNVITATGTPVNRGLVYINIGGKLISTITSASGNYIAQIGDINEINKDSALLEFFVQADSSNVATAKAYPKSARPLATIIIGQNHDFRNNPENESGENPDANLNLPEDVEKKSKFNIPTQTTLPSVPSVTLKTLDDGETITSTQPEFSGEGPKGATFTIKVESENPMTDEVKVSNSGTWKWAVPEGLAEGAHKVTISWIENGITRTLTRNFIVQAGELPAFEATPSQTLAASPTATAKSTPTASPKTTATATASAKPIPETGTASVTFILLFVGVLGFMSSYFVLKYS